MRLRPWLWPAAVFGIALAALIAGLIVVDRSGEAVIAKQQAAIAASARDYFVSFAKEEGIHALSAAIERRERTGSPDGFRYAVVDAKGHVVAGADVVGQLDVPDAGWRTVAEQAPHKHRLWRVLAEPLGSGDTLIVAEDLRARDGLRNAILRGSIVALILMSLGAAAGGVWLRAMLLRRTRDIAHTAERIAAGDLSARATVHPGGDVFDHLAQAINGMLTRIEELMTGMRTVTDSLAHDLRSPLTRVKAALAKVDAPHLDDEARAEAVEQANGEVDYVLATLSALLDIARAETGLSREMMRRVDVGALVMELTDLFAPAIEDAGQILQVDIPEAPVLAQVHQALMRQALGNLLHNAATHAGDGATVQVRVQETAPGTVELIVEDDGPGVPVGQLGRVQERFVRLEEARTTHGSGLGLAVVAACAKLHDGRLVLQDSSPGLRAILELPANRAPAAP